MTLLPIVLMLACAADNGLEPNYCLPEDTNTLTDGSTHCGDPSDACAIDCSTALRTCLDSIYCYEGSVFECSDGSLTLNGLASMDDLGLDLCQAEIESDGYCYCDPYEQDDSGPYESPEVW